MGVVLLSYFFLSPASIVNIYSSENDNGSYIVVIAVKKIKNIVQLKGLIVHEITHATDYIMRQNDFTDMEFRAYCNQAMYQSSIEWIDNKLASNRSTRED